MYIARFATQYTTLVITLCITDNQLTITWLVCWLGGCGASRGVFTAPSQMPGRHVWTCRVSRFLLHHVQFFIHWSSCLSPPRFIFIYHDATAPPVCQGLLIVEVSRSHSDTPHSVGLLWTSDKPNAETFTWKHTTLTRDIQDPGGIRTHNLSRRAAADQRVRPRGHRGRRFLIVFVFDAAAPSGPGLPQRRTTLGRTSLDEWSARRTDLYLTTHNTHNGHPSKPRTGFEPTISAGEGLQNHALDRTAIWIGVFLLSVVK